MEAHLTPEKILQTGFAFWASKTLLSAIEMGLFTELAHGAERFETLHARLGLHARSARDFFDALVSLGFLKREGDSYGNTPETDALPRPQEALVHRRHARDGQPPALPLLGPPDRGAPYRRPQNEVKTGGPGLFETLYADPARLKEFLTAMTGLSHGANLTIARAFPWKEYKTFVDVGTAQGDLAVQIALANPHLQAARGLDLAEVAPIFEEYTAGDRRRRSRVVRAVRLLQAGACPRPTSC